MKKFSGTAKFAKWHRPIPQQYPSYDHAAGHTKERQSIDFYAIIDATFVLIATAMSIFIAWIFLREGLTTNPGRLLNLLVFWLIFTYVALPRIHQVLTKIYVPDYFIGRTRTADGLLGDPVNLAFEGSEIDIHVAMQRAGWVLADENTLHSARRMVTSALTFRSYPEAPVSSLFLFGRQHEFAYQQEVGGNTIKRHHIRFWRAPRGWVLPGGHRVTWLAAATYDRSVGFSRYTWQVTHKIDENTDVERDYVVDTLLFADPKIQVGVIRDFFTSYHHVNGGGDPLKTDGHLPVVNVSAAENRAQELAGAVPQELTPEAEFITSPAKASHASQAQEILASAREATKRTAAANSRATYLKGRTLRHKDLFDSIADNWHDAVDDVLELFKHPGERHIPPASILFTGLMLALQSLATIYLWLVNIWLPGGKLEQWDLGWLDAWVSELLLQSSNTLPLENLYAITAIMLALLLVYLLLLFRNRWARLILMSLLALDSLLRLSYAWGVGLAGELELSALMGLGLSSLALLTLTSDAARLWVLTARASQLKHSGAAPPAAG